MHFRLSEPLTPLCGTQFEKHCHGWCQYIFNFVMSLTGHFRFLFTCTFSMLTMLTVIVPIKVPLNASHYSSQRYATGQTCPAKQTSNGVFLSPYVHTRCAVAIFRPATCCCSKTRRVATLATKPSNCTFQWASSATFTSTVSSVCPPLLIYCVYYNLCPMSPPFPDLLFHVPDNINWIFCTGN
jgi:hypothetical protein